MLRCGSYWNDRVEGMHTVYAGPRAVWLHLMAYAGLGAVWLRCGQHRKLQGFDGDLGGNDFALPIKLRGDLTGQLAVQFGKFAVRTA